MSLVLHIAWKDFRRMQGWLWVWAALVVSPLLLGWWLIAGSSLGEPSRRWPDVMSMLTVIQLAYAYLFTVLLFQEDRVVGTQAFWLTRPISGLRLLAAKWVAAFTMLALLAVVVSLPWWLSCNFTPADIARAAVETTLVLALPIVLGAAVATLTDSFPRAMLWTLVVAAVALFGGIAFAMSVGRKAEGISLAVARMVVAAVIVTLEIAAVVAWQFVQRRRTWWLGVAAAVVIGSTLAASRWPHPWIPTEPRERNPERAASATVEYVRTEHPTLDAKADRALMGQRLDTVFRVAGIPPNRLLVPFDGWQTWRWGSTEVRRRPVLHVDAWPQLQERAFGLRVPDAAGLARHSNETDAFILTADVFMPSSLAERIRQEPPEMEARLWLQSGRADVACELPLRTTGRASGRATGLRLNRVVRAAAASANQPVRIETVLTRPASLGQILRNAAMRDSPTRAASAGGFFGGLFVFNRTRGEFLPLTLSAQRDIVVHGVRIVWNAGEVGVRHGRRREQLWAPAPDWIDQASLAAVWILPEAELKRELTVRLGAQP